jgi:uncharacterized protein YegL
MPVLVLADVSGSMDGEKILQLNRSVDTMFRSFAAEDSVRGEIQVAVITFGGAAAALHQPMTPASRLIWTDMVAGGRTPLGEALRLAAEILEDEEQVPLRAFPPTLVLVSDGAPTDEWEESMAELLESKRGASALRLSIGIGVDRVEEAQRVLGTFTSSGMAVMSAEQAHEISTNFRWVTETVTGQLQERRGVRLEDFS